MAAAALQHGLHHGLQKPEVLIVGAGLAGLMLGMLLERIDVPYQIYERAPTVKPLGNV
jgi:2-polyprenyl-6-methoxyphenol hydroxylase-like FAD-dependent oxidoreductase